jgi:PadR family transcriptional regulator, regulatory protein PadR
MIMGTIDGDALRGHLETMVLSVVEANEAHGYEILRRLELRGSGSLALKEGTLYPLLYRLEQAGLLRARWETGATERRGPRRRVYSITKSGTRELERRRGAWREFVGIVGSIVEAT